MFTKSAGIQEKSTKLRTYTNGFGIAAFIGLTIDFADYVVKLN
jgi:hypothetical protein